MKLKKELGVGKGLRWLVCKKLLSTSESPSSLNCPIEKGADVRFGRGFTAWSISSQASFRFQNQAPGSSSSGSPSSLCELDRYESLCYSRQTCYYPVRRHSSKRFKATTARLTSIECSRRTGTKT